MHTFPHHSPLQECTRRAAELRPIRILIQYGDPLVRAGLRAALEDSPEFKLLPSGATYAGMPHELQGASALDDAQADIVVTDYEQGLALIAKGRTRARQGSAPTPHVLIVTPRENEWDIRQALEMGVRGYLSLGCELAEVVDAVRALHVGMRHIGQRAARRLADSVSFTPLTSRETDVVRLVAQGHCTKVVAHELNISQGTVKSHLKAIFEKLGAKSRTEVAMVAQQRGLLNPCANTSLSRLAAAAEMQPPMQPSMLHMHYRPHPMLGTAAH